MPIIKKIINWNLDNSKQLKITQTKRLISTSTMALLATKAASAFSLSPWIWGVGFLTVGGPLIGWLVVTNAAEFYQVETLKTKVKSFSSICPQVILKYNQPWSFFETIVMPDGWTRVSPNLQFVGMQEKDRHIALYEIGQIVLGLTVSLFKAILDSSLEDTLHPNVTLHANALKAGIYVAKSVIFLRVLGVDRAQLQEVIASTSSSQTYYSLVDQAIKQPGEPLNVSLLMFSRVFMNWLFQIEFLCEQSHYEKLEELCRQDTKVKQWLNVITVWARNLPWWSRY